MPDTWEETEMAQNGPIVSDAYFFGECLNWEAGGMEAVRIAAEREDYPAARHALAQVIRDWAAEKREGLLTIPYEMPENAVILPEESEEEACRRIQKHVVVSVGVPCDFGAENRVDWESNPTYNGYREWTWQLNRHHEWKMLAHQWNLTHDDTLAETAAELFVSWVRQAVFPGPCTGYETKCWRTIECGIRMGCTWPYVLFTFAGTEAFTDDILVDWYKSVWEHGDRLSRDYTSGNWLIMEMNGLAQIGILYPQLKQAGAWLEQALDFLGKELDRQIYPDGFQYELTTNYHVVVILNYQRLAEVAGAFGQKLPESFYEKLENACLLYVRLMMPDGTTPDINDGRRVDVKEDFQIRRRMLPQAKCIRWVLEGNEEDRPDFTSVALEYSGFLVMRSGWDKDAVWALLDAAPFGKAHQHEDKLNLLLYANGRLLVTEGGNYAYDSSPMRDYVLSTRSHNTVRVDGQDQNRKLRYSWKDEDIRKKAGLRYEITEEQDTGEASYEEGYGENADIAVKHTRKVFFLEKSGQNRPPYLVIVDRMEAEEPHEYECLWHVDDIVREQKEGQIAFTDLRLLYAGGEAEIVTGQEEPEWQGFVATGTVQGQYRAVPCVCLRRTGRNVCLVTVLDPAPQYEKQVVRVELKNERAVSGIRQDAVKIRLYFKDGTCREVSES